MEPTRSPSATHPSWTRQTSLRCSPGTTPGPTRIMAKMNMEYRHWSGSHENFEYFVSPFYAGQNAIRAYMPPATLIHSLRWEAGRATFRTVRSSDPASKVVAENIFTSGIPVHGIESFRMCFYIDRFHGLPSQEGSEV